MKLRPQLRYFFFGVLTTALCAIIAIHGNNDRWQMDAFDHYAAMWKMDLKTGRKTWMWLDDYFVEELSNAHYTTPTPEPILTERL